MLQAVGGVAESYLIALSRPVRLGETREQRVYIWGLWNLNDHRQARRVLADMLHLDPLTSIQGRQERFKMLTELVVRCGRVRCVQPIVAA
jgi:hypothetical protein